MMFKKAIGHEGSTLMIKFNDLKNWVWSFVKTLFCHVRNSGPHLWRKQHSRHHLGSRGGALNRY
jgi:hypothetical protein